MSVNVSDLVREAAERDPDGVALVEHRPERRQLTWRQLDETVDGLARALSGRGLVAGQRVAVVMANRVDLPIAYFGILRGGMVAVPINPRSTPREIGRMLADSVSRVVLADDAGIESVRVALDHLEADGQQAPVVIVDGADPRDGETAFSAFLGEATTTAPAAPPDPESPAVILYTSGTSGRPRGATLSHRALLANIDQIASLENLPVGPDDVVLGLLPLFHVYGLNAILGQAVRQGARVVMVDGFDPVGLPELIRAEGITNLPLAPPVVAAWAGRPELREALSGVRTILSGAANLDPDLAEAFHESAGHWIEQGYGMTEASPVVAVTLASKREPGAAPKPGSVGHPLPGVEVRIAEADGTEASPGDPAQIWIRGANLFSGYWPDGADGPDADGWYATGDIGLLDADGDLTIVDRLKELVIVSGFNVYPTEVEDVIADVTGVVQVAVVGQPDPETGEAVVAFVDVADGSDEDVVVEAVRAECRTRLARFKQPTRIIVVPGLPRSATGKIEKGRLRAQARADDLGLR